MSGRVTLTENVLPTASAAIATKRAVKRAYSLDDVQFRNAIQSAQHSTGQDSTVIARSYRRDGAAPISPCLCCRAWFGLSRPSVG